MSLHGLAAHQAVFNTLTSALAPVAVYDIAPEDAAMPFVDISAQQMLPITAGTPYTGQFAEHHLYLTVWSNYRGQAEVLGILNQIHAALHNQTFSLDGTGRAVICQVQSADSRLDADGLSHQGAVTLRLLVAN